MSAEEMPAVDLALRVIALSDAVCSGGAKSHDAAVDLLTDRFSIQLSPITTEEFLSAGKS